MKTFTRYMRNDTGSEVKAVFWDGDFNVYKTLLHDEPEFVAVLDDSGQRGKDRVKLWNKEKSAWEVCQLGHYIIKTEKETFTVKSRDEVAKELRPIR